MDNYFACFGFLSCLVLGSLAMRSVSVCRDVTVKPTPDPLIDVEDRVDVTLNCTGNSSDLNFYIKNRVKWAFITRNGSEIVLSQGFYPTRDGSAMFSGVQSRYEIDYRQESTGYNFYITILGVNQAADGIYRCSQMDEDNTVLDSEDVKLTVVNPVEMVSMELYDTQQNVLTQSDTPITQDQRPVQLIPGDYMVKCDANGSNPEPIMSLFYNNQSMQVSVWTETDVSVDRASYIGTFSVTNLTVSAETTVQALVCSANIAGEYYKPRAAGISVLILQVNIVCENTSAAITDKREMFKCNISSKGNNAALKCESVSWFLSNSSTRIGYDQRWTEPTRNYDMESKCLKGADGLSVTLELFTIQPEMFFDVYSVVYGVGQNAREYYFVLHDATTDEPTVATQEVTTIVTPGVTTVVKPDVITNVNNAATDIAATPRSLLINLVMAVISNHLIYK